MKISLNKFRYAALACFLCLLTGCQQDEIMQQNQQRENTATVGSVASRSVTCEVTTTEAGTLMAKLDEIASSGGYSKEDITDLTISGPVNREDLRALRPFKNMTKLDMTDLTIINEFGEKTDYFPDNALDSLKSPAHVYMPVSINIIGNEAFRESKITAIDMPDNIIYLYTMAFWKCKYLHSVKLSNNIEEIYYHVFQECSSLVTINAPEKLKRISGDAFNGCAFSSFTIPESVEFIEWSAFANNPNLETIHWPSKVTTIPSSCFENCPKLIFDIPNYILRIEHSAFASCTMPTIYIPESVEYIGPSAFCRNPNLVSINWPSKVTEILYNCFYQCPMLKFDIPNHITKIGNGAFRGCSTITNLTIPSSVETIGSSSFADCNNLISVVLPTTLMNVGDYAFAYCKKLQTVNGISNWTKIPDGIFYDCSALEFDIPLQVDSIGMDAFTNCKKLTTKMPEQLKYIGHYAFRSCTSLPNPILPTTLKYIGHEAFANCKQINEIVIPEGVEYIGNYAFYSTSIKELAIPSSAQNIEYYIVAECPYLKVIFWNTTADMPELFYSWNNFGTLIYAKAGINYNSNNKNLIWGDDETGYTTDRFEINGDKDFYCPKAFTAKEVVFRKHFGAWTYPDRTGGWRTIALPFTVTKFIAQANGEQPERELKPFGTEDMGDSKPFWLRTLHDNEFKREIVLEAGKPYIIAFPYNPNYYLPEYNIWGTIEFWGENVTVLANTQLTPIMGTAYTFQPTFEKIKKSMDIYNIDYNDYNDRMNNIYYEGGSLFRSSIRDTEPFEGYLTNNVSGRSVIPIGNTSSSRSIKKLGIKPMEDDM